MRNRKTAIPGSETGNGNQKIAALALLAALAGCAGMEPPALGGSRATGGAAAGAAAGAVAGNVLGYMTDSDRKTATVLGALIGGGLGYWQGMEADKRLQQAQTTAQEVAQVGSQSAYRYDQPQLQARQTTQAGQKVATFDKLETPIPLEAVRDRSDDASTVLRKLGGLAAHDNAPVYVYAPSLEMRNYMTSELRKGAGGASLKVSGANSQETKVIIGHVPGG